MKATRKIMAFVLTVVMTMSLLVPVLAIGNSTGGNQETGGTKKALSFNVTDGKVADKNPATITLAPTVEGDSFTAYEIMTWSYNSTTQELTYTWNTSFQTWAEQYFTETTEDPITAYQNMTNADEIKAALGSYAAYAKTNSVTSYTSSRNTDKTADTISVPYGQYVVVGEYKGTDKNQTQKIFQVMTATFVPELSNGNYNINDEVTINPKYSEPSIEKKIVTSDASKVDTSTATIGSTVNFEITADIPIYPADATKKTFKIGDTLSTGLALATDNDIEVKVGGQTLEAGEGKDYTFTPKENSTGFEIVFDYDKVVGKKTDNATTITVTYSATVTKDIPITTGADNTATLTYNTAPYDENGYEVTPGDKTTTYTYELDVVKHEAGNENTMLKGVEFSLKKGNVEVKLSRGEDGIYYPDENGSDSIVTDENGMIQIKGIDVGTYKLTETKTIPGYKLDTNPISIILTDNDLDGTLEGTNTDTLTFKDGVAEQKVANQPITSTLPQTGGIGVWIFIGIGLLVMIVGVFVMIRMERKRKMQE